jgi:ferredoxin
MRVIVDRERCIAAGMCVLTAPEVFDQDEEDGRVVLLQSEPGAEHHDVVRQAERLCPSGAITVLDDD